MARTLCSNFKTERGLGMRLLAIILLLVLIEFQVRKVVEPVRDFLAVFFFASLGESVHKYMYVP